MNTTPVISSTVAAVGYDPNTLTLEVEFKNGSVYQYFDFPETAYREFIQASSLGQFMHANIKNNYRYVKL